MKKFTLLVAALSAGMWCTNAQVNNPMDGEGYYIVKWDCANDTWAAANDFEVDETFTFAVDVTGTPLETWLKETPTNAGATRAIAVNKWTGYGELNGDSHRLKQIRGNIYGATWNIYQLAAGMDTEKATMTDSVTYVYGSVFGYEYTPDNPGASWYQNAIENIAGEGGAFFKTLPYTGTKTSEEFYNDEHPGLFEEDYPVQGYAPACALEEGSGIETVETAFDMADVVATECYNLQGQKLGSEPLTGLYIKTFILNNGSRVSQKVLATQR